MSQPEAFISNICCFHLCTT